MFRNKYTAGRYYIIHEIVSLHPWHILKEKKVNQIRRRKSVAEKILSVQLELVSHKGMNKKRKFKSL